MKKWLVYLLGVITGIMLMSMFTFYFSQSDNAKTAGLESSEKSEKGVTLSDLLNRIVANKKDAGKTLFDKPGDCVSQRSFKVQRVLDSGDAIAREVRVSGSRYVLASDLIVLVLAKEGSHFYDRQIIKAPQGKCARQIGNYRYQVSGVTRVIPIIAFE